MKFQACEDGYFVCLDRGEKVIHSLLEWVEQRRIESGVITGIGAVMNSRLGFYHLSQKRYEEKFHAPEAELISLSGNISWFTDKPVVHCHVCLGDTEFRAIVGHLFEAEVAVTVEIYLSVKNERICRTFRPEMGLNLMELGCEF